MPYPVKGFLEIYEGTYVVDVGGRFSIDSEAEDLFCGTSTGSEPSPFFSNYLFSLGV